MQTPDESTAPGFFATRMGAYYPNHHAVVAIGDDQSEGFVKDLSEAGFGSSDVYQASAEEMADFLRRTMTEAGVLAQMVGSELKQSEILLQLAESGCRFVIVRIEDEAQKEKLMRAGGRYRPSKAIYFHTLAIEELPISENAIPGSSPYGVNEIPREDV
jgi:hypothetical protein